MRSASVSIAVGIWALSLVSAGSPTASFAATEPKPYRSVTVTTDSALGWLPSEELEKQARATALAYLAAKDSGHAKEAYALLTEPLREQMPWAYYSTEVAKFNRQAGPVRQRRILLISWTKDPAQSAGPGVYAALDLASTFAKVERHCGYLVLYQPPEGGAFTVMREEANMMTDAQYESIVRTQSKAEADKVWSALSANCPNYPEPPAVVVPPR